MSGHLFSESADRNRHVILPVLAEWLPEPVTVLELGSGTGQHAVHFAEHLPHLVWQPSEREPALLRSIRAHRADAGLANLREPLELDIGLEWPAVEVGAAVCINVVHIAPWSVAEGLFAGAGACLPPGGVLVTYGPYRVDGRCTTESNAAFDASLRERDAAWGIRDVAAIAALAEANGLVLEERRPTPVNNFTLRFRRSG